MASGGGEPRELEPCLGHEVGGDDARPATVADDRDPAPRGPVRCEAREDTVDELLGRRHPQDSRCPARSVDSSRVARERTGVRGGRPRSRLAAAGSEQDDLLACFPGRLSGASERSPVAEVLAVDGDHPGVRVGREGRDELGGFEVGLIPERRDPRDPDPVLAAQEAQLQDEVAALGDDAQRAGREIVHAEIEGGGCVVEAERVGAEHHHARPANLLDDAALELPAVLVDLAEPGRDRDDPSRAGGQRGVDGLLERGGGDRDDHELGRPWQLVERGVRRLPEDLSALTVDEPDVAPVGTLENPGADPLAPLGRVIRRAEDGDRAGIEERPQVARGVRGSCDGRAYRKILKPDACCRASRGS